MFKVIAIIAAAAGIGFAGSYMATGNKCDGGCPISNLLGLNSAQNEDCCDLPQGSCCEAKTASKAESGCCSKGKACCEAGESCCEPSAVKVFKPTATPDCCFPGSPCCEGADCCLKVGVQIRSTVPDCCFPGSPCCTGQGPDCCLKK